MSLWVGKYPPSRAVQEVPNSVATNASNLVPESEAGAHGCDLLLYLDNNGYLQESGTMNIFAITSEGELVTPSLGTILGRR
jgi:branched-chain amino acid aminotransferase